MSSSRLKFRQIHLDFHTSPAIPSVGECFDKAQWQECLRIGHVDSITCFSKCHHGWSYHPTEVGLMHPNLKLDLLRAQFDASKEIGVNVPIYLSAGLDDVIGEMHPQWRQMTVDGQYYGRRVCVTDPGFISMCFNSPYLHYLCAQIEESVKLFPSCDGVFLDIVIQGECCCKYCLDYMAKNGLDPGLAKDRQICATAALEHYYIQSTAACRSNNPNMPVFHNSGHVAKGQRDILQYFSHLELESLPTGGWGYDHFPMSAKYAANLGMDYLGMTGKFHRFWGEFGGFKHPNALRYECGVMLANGSRCSVGDQLHPNGAMDKSTYQIVGAAYADVEKKEPWCDDVVSIADIAVLSSEAENGEHEPDIGAGRALLESHFLFDLIDREMDFSPYKLLVLPDVIAVDADLKCKIDAYLAGGGKLLLTGKSGLAKENSGFAFDIGGEFCGESPFHPNYIEIGNDLAPDFVDSPLVMYMRSQQVRSTSGEVLAKIREPYFNRSGKHFCSHQHAPSSGLSEYAGAIRKENILYLAHPIFSIYYAIGAVAYREYISKAISMMLTNDISLLTNLPSTARITLMKQPQTRRYIVHLLSANMSLRGGQVKLSDDGYVIDGYPVEVIEDVQPLFYTELSMKLPGKVQCVTLEPQGESVEFSENGEKVKICLSEFSCHQMVVLHY